MANITHPKNNLSDLRHTGLRTTVLLATACGILHAAEPEWKQLIPLPDAYGFACPFAGVSQGALIIAGGANFPFRPVWQGGPKTWHDRIFVLETEAGPWKVAGHLTAPRGYGVSVTTPQGVICAGGSDSTRHYAEVFLLRWTGKAVEQVALPSLPEPLANSAGAVVGETLFLAGGLSSPSSTEPRNAFYSLNISHPEEGWKTLPSWPGPGRSQPVAASSNGAFFLLSGLTFRKDETGKAQPVYLKDAYVYIPEQGWQTLPDLSFPAVAGASPAPTLDDGTIIVIGGADGSAAGKPFQDFPLVPQRIQALAPDRKSWHAAGQAPMGRVCVSTAFWNNAWVLPTGEQSPGIRSPDIWRVSWSSGDATPTSSK